MPREANFTHMFRTFIPSNGPICLSKCVCCVLFPARFVPVPSLQWAPHSPGVRAKASRYLYRPNSWGPPSQSREMRGQGDGWRIYHGNFRLNQPLEMSLCSLFLFLFFFNSLFLSFICFSLLGSQVLARPVCVQVSWTAGQTSLTNTLFHFPSPFYVFFISRFDFCFFSFSPQLMFLPPPPSPLQLKS